MTDDFIARLREEARLDNEYEAADALEAKDKLIAELERELACIIVSANDAHEQALGYVYELNDAAKRILARLGDERVFIDEIPAEHPTTNPIAPSCDFLCHLVSMGLE